MTAILIRTIRNFDSLAEAKAQAAKAFEADEIAGRSFLGSLPFGVVAVRADGRADLLEQGIRGAEPVVFA